MKKTTSKILTKLNKTVSDSGLKKKKIADEIGVSPQHLSYVLAGTRTLTVDLHAKIEAVCK